MRLRKRRRGHDTNGMPVKLGEKDTDGFHVGYIDEEGACWESRRERDIAVGSSRIFDNYFGARGLVFPTTEIDDILKEAGVLKKHRYAACKEYINEQMLRSLLRSKKRDSNDKEN